MRVNIGVKLVYVPPVASVNVLRYRVVAAGTQVLPVKSNKSNELPLVSVGIAAPLVI